MKTKTGPETRPPSFYMIVHILNSSGVESKKRRTEEEKKKVEFGLDDGR
jgi:hypothetical protein